MQFKRLEIPDIVLIEPQINGDDRGYFIETFRADLLESFLGFKVNFCQDNQSKSSKNVLRGLHYQLPPFAQSKLVSVIKGAVLDVAVDIRVGSPSFAKSVCVELNENNKRQIFIPRGFAHGFKVLEDDTIFAYKVDNYYSPKCDRGISFNDANLKIDWGDMSNLNLSQKDINAKKLESVSSSELFIYKENYYV